MEGDKVIFTAEEDTAFEKIMSQFNKSSNGDKEVDITPEFAQALVKLSPSLARKLLLLNEANQKAEDEFTAAQIVSLKREAEIIREALNSIKQ
jgi:hypothetical protein